MSLHFTTPTFLFFIFLIILFYGCVSGDTDVMALKTSSLLWVTQSQFSFFSSFSWGTSFLEQSLLTKIAEALLCKQAGITENPGSGKRNCKVSYTEPCWLPSLLLAPCQVDINFNHYFSSLFLTFQKFVFKDRLWIPSHLTGMTKMKKQGSWASLPMSSQNNNQHLTRLWRVSSSQQSV